MPRRGPPETPQPLSIWTVTASQQKPAVATAPAAGTVPSVREGCQPASLRPVPRLRATPVRHRLASMKERARDQGGPGTLTDELATPDITVEPLPGESLAELAAKY